MRIFAPIALASAALLAATSPAFSAQTFELYADSTMDGHNGSLMRVIEPGYGGITVFFFEEEGKNRVYAERPLGSDAWTVKPGAQYICKSTTMTIGETWRFLDDGVEETQATVGAQESVTTDAGTFSCYRVDVERVSNPGTVIESLWFSDGVGLVKERDFFDGPTPSDWQAELLNYTIVGGSGFWPRSVGNVWNYKETILPVETTTWGAIKSEFR